MSADNTQQPPVCVKARDLKPGMWIRDRLGDMLVDSVEDTRDDQVRVRLGYRLGDDTATSFFERDEGLWVRGK